MNLWLNAQIFDNFSEEALNSSSHYKGQVYLCPPDEFPTGKCSVSTGLVRIWAYNEWRGINQNSSKSPLGSHVADSICRQLGYTNAVMNSAMTLNSTTLSYSHCYYIRYIIFILYFQCICTLIFMLYTIFILHAVLLHKLLSQLIN